MNSIYLGIIAIIVLFAIFISFERKPEMETVQVIKPYDLCEVYNNWKSKSKEHSPGMDMICDDVNIKN